MTPALGPRRLRVARVADAGGGCVRVVLAPAPGPVPEPAQFYMVRGDWGDDPLLPRPFSVARWRVGPEGVSLEFLLRVVGRGTARLAALAPGDPLDVLGPLGHGFPAAAAGAHAFMVAGGIGVAPFPALAERLHADGVQATLLLGARTAADLPGTADFDGLLAEPPGLATDDGTAGHDGHVVSLLAARLQAGPLPDVVYACGPDPMLRATAAACEQARVPCIVSLEAPMACGMGTCRGCVIRRADGENLAVCVDGPAVDASVVWGPTGA